jgi:hypothetical protein
LKENDVLMEWLLQDLFKIGKHPHPHSRQVINFKNIYKPCFYFNIPKYMENINNILSVSDPYPTSGASKHLHENMLMFSS